MKLKTPSKDSKNAHSSQPFFSKDNEGSFLSESQETQNTFFSPPAVQAKPAVDKALDKKEEETNNPEEEVIQRTDAPNTIMRKTAYNPMPQMSNYVFSAPLVKNNIQASPGEQILFTVLFSDADHQRNMSDQNSRWTPFVGKGPYSVSYQVSGGGEFNAPGSGAKKYIDKSLITLPGNPLPRIMSNNTKLFIEKSWNKKTSIKVTATISDLANPAVAPDTGTTKDADHTITWTIVGRKHPCPTKLVPVGNATGSKWIPTGLKTYSYQASSSPPPKTRPYYENQTILETFGAIKALGFTMNDIEDSWKKANPSIKTPDLVARKIFKVVAANATFVINNKDEIYDQHGLNFNTKFLAPFKASAFTKGIGFTTPQSYFCDGKVIGTAKIQWLFKGSKSSPQQLLRKIGP